MDYVKEITELREQLNGGRNDKTDLCHREIKHELILKREQVTQLRNELASANSTIVELRTELDSHKSIRKELEFNLKLALKKSAVIEEKQKGMHETFTDLQLKEQMRLTEMEVLKDNVHKKAQENHQLNRELAELNDKLQYVEAHQSEIDERQTRINSTIAKIKTDTEKLEIEHMKLIQLDEKFQAADEYKKLYQIAMQKYEVLKKDFASLEEAFIETTAKYDKLSSLIIEQRYMNLDEQNALSKIKFLLWEHRCRKFQEENILNQEKISTLTETMHREVEANAQLIIQTEDYEERIKELEKMLPLTKLVKKEDECSTIEIN